MPLIKPLPPPPRPATPCATTSCAVGTWQPRTAAPRMRVCSSPVLHLSAGEPCAGSGHGGRHWPGVLAVTTRTGTATPAAAENSVTAARAGAPVQLHPVVQLRPWVSCAGAGVGGTGGGGTLQVLHTECRTSAQDKIPRSPMPLTPTHPRSQRHTAVRTGTGTLRGTFIQGASSKGSGHLEPTGMKTTKTAWKKKKHKCNGLIPLVRIRDVFCTHHPRVLQSM